MLMRNFLLSAIFSISLPWIGKIMIGISAIGSFAHTNAFLRYIAGDKMFSDLNAFGHQGVDALRQATPRESGETAASWAYRITFQKGHYHIEWYNTHVEEGVNVAVILQYGHATGTGGYVEGIDYINPAMQPIFAELVNNVWKKVNSA